MPALWREVGPHQNGKVTDAAPICTTWVNRTGVQALVCRFVSGFGFVFVRQTFVFGDRAAIASGKYSYAGGSHGAVIGGGAY